MLKVVANFWKVSGRGYHGWITSTVEHICPHCHKGFGKAIERSATPAEYYGVILPALKDDPSKQSVSLRVEEE